MGWNRIANVTREAFRRLVAEELDLLPDEFRQRMDNIVVLVEAEPPKHPRTPAPRSVRPHKLLLGLFVGTPRTQKSVFNLAAGPDRVILYQNNIEAVCRTEAEVRREVRLTVIHEVGHFFGLDEDQLRHV